MIRVHCDHCDFDLTVRINSVKIQYQFFDDGEQKLWNLIFCNEFCVATYFGNVGRDRIRDGELGEAAIQ